jgi:hypothetical protein
VSAVFLFRPRRAFDSTPESPFPLAGEECDSLAVDIFLDDSNDHQRIAAVLRPPTQEPGVGLVNGQTEFEWKVVLKSTQRLGTP